MKKLIGTALFLLFLSPANSTVLIRRLAAPAGCSDVETTGLTAFYKYEEGSGTSVDDAIGSNNLSLFNTPTWTTGQCGSGGLSFSAGSSEYGSSDTGEIIGNSNTYTVCTWFKSSQASWGTFASEANSGSDTQLFELGLSGVVAGDIITAFRDDSSASTDFNTADVNSDDNAWHFTCIRQTTTNARHIYFDGVIIATNTVSIGDRTMDNFNVGRLGRLSDTDYYTGVLDNTRVYAATALSEDQMDNIYANEQ